MEGEYVPEDQRFAVFSGDSTGPIWYGFFSTLEAAKQKAKNLAASDGLEFFVFRLRQLFRVARCFPPKR